MDKANFIKTLLKSSVELGRAIQKESDPYRRENIAKSWSTVASVINEWVEMIMECDEQDLESVLLKTEEDISKISEKFVYENELYEVEDALDEIDSFMDYKGKKVEA